jgi:hypothetical protein
LIDHVFFVFAFWLTSCQWLVPMTKEQRAEHEAEIALRDELAEQQRRELEDPLYLFKLDQNPTEAELAAKRLEAAEAKFREVCSVCLKICFRICTFTTFSLVFYFPTLIGIL